MSGSPEIVCSLIRGTQKCGKLSIGEAQKAHTAPDQLSKVYKAKMKKANAEKTKEWDFAEGDGGA